MHSTLTFNLISRCGLCLFRYSLYDFPTSCSGFLLIATSIGSLCSAAHSSGLRFFYTEAALHCSGNEMGPQWEWDSRPSCLVLFFMTYQIDCTRMDFFFFNVRRMYYNRIDYFSIYRLNLFLKSESFYIYLFLFFHSPV